MIINPKEIKYTRGKCSVNSLKFEFKEDTDGRILRRAERLFGKDAPTGAGTPVYVAYENNSCDDLSFNAFQGYTLEIRDNSILIAGESAQGAFYGLNMLYALLSEKTELECAVITDSPDILHRGFYLDVSRGRIPAVAEIKKLIDRLALCNVNSLQLYIEHTFEFKGLEEINAEYGCYTAEDIGEILKYCDEMFIDLIPSLSTFGHMYIILQNEKYKHLCELENYEPKDHIWWERMRHHTINYADDESIALVKSFIDSYAGLFKSKYFNICCDETFDIAKGRNKGADKIEAYLSFVKKITAHLTENNLIPMMWGDIIWERPESIKELPEEIILLNWNYDADISDKSIKYYAEHNCNQIVCPGVSCWNRMCECISVSKDNILKSVDYAFENKTKGVLNTCWGDFGHTAPPENCIYGMALCAAKSWNAENFDIDEFSLSASRALYGYNGNIADILIKAEPLYSIWSAAFTWLQIRKGLSDPADVTAVEILERESGEAAEAVKMLESAEMDADIKANLILAAKINLLLSNAVIKKLKNEPSDEKDISGIEEAYSEYRKMWCKTNKKDELFILDEYFEDLKHNLQF